MLETHVTREGQSILIAQMGDDHLRNMVRFILKAVREIRAKSEASDLNPYQAALYGIRNVDPQEAARINREAIRKLYPYLAEAFLRGLDDLRDEVAEAIGRDSALPGGLPAIAARSGRVLVDDEDLCVDPMEF